MLQKVGVEDNNSFYNDGKGKKDFILNLIWAVEFEPLIQRHLSKVDGEHVKA